ncbi:hypothetical protein [cf. Phormidesmis sp. LEGE 11477]|uniref:slr1601 family putative cell division protein n=1 Tax=cf. Phormidesmis sp. LEGE 11477 TaxID=1828680 RepID=UPI00187E8B9A|nr:hypothetical protein [cf. Phormidesmis sp. LEGE 11477]MBE9059687.1 hypothetical protein [cf. Phormidesmis sp. LEGE 11477]
MNAAKRPISSSSQSLQSKPLQIAHPTKPRRSYQPRRVPFSGVRRAIAFESSVKLTVNLLLTVIASTTIAKLVPYYQAQQERLGTLQHSVAQEKEKNAELREQFDRNFDPAQTAQIMQEQSGMGYPNQKKVIWTKPLD